MPNWCVNKLSVRGPKADVAAFWHAARERSPDKAEAVAKRILDGESENLLDFNAFVPYPTDYRIADEEHSRNPALQDGYNHGGYEWCRAQWGTKWNACETVNDGRGQLVFRTAWGPPLPVIRAMGERFPTLTFTLRYFEGGAGFKGKYVIDQGKVVENTHGDYRGGLGG